MSIGSASRQTCKAAAQLNHSGDRQAGGGGRWCQGPRIPLRTIGWQLVRMRVQMRVKGLVWSSILHKELQP